MSPTPRGTTGSLGVMRHVVLVGMMGSGKTEAGRELARLLGRCFVDCDELVAAAAQCSIPEIFAAEGEAGFRRRESETLAAVLAGGPAAVVATGGGVVIGAANRRLLRDATVCWLRARPEALAARVGDDPGRPLLAPSADSDSDAADGPLEKLNRIGAERNGWYREVADIVLDVDELTVADAAAALAQRLACLAELPPAEVAP